MDALTHLRETTAILEGHFRLTSGLHSDRYLQCARVLMYPERAADLCIQLATRWGGDRPDLVVGPALGAVTFSYEMARGFGCPGIFVERVDGAFALRRGFSIEPGAKVIIAEDVVTTGGSVREVIELLETQKATTLGVVTLVQRSSDNPFDVPLTSLLTLTFDSWLPADCPRCRAGEPVVKPGSRPTSPMEGAS